MSQLSLDPEVQACLSRELPVDSLLFILNEKHLHRPGDEVQLWADVLKQNLYDTLGSFSHLSAARMRQLKDSAGATLPGRLQDYLATCVKILGKTSEASKSKARGTTSISASSSHLPAASPRESMPDNQAANRRDSGAPASRDSHVATSQAMAPARPQAGCSLNLWLEEQLHAAANVLRARRSSGHYNHTFAAEFLNKHRDVIKTPEDIAVFVASVRQRPETSRRLTQNIELQLTGLVRGTIDDLATLVSGDAPQSMAAGGASESQRPATGATGGPKRGSRSSQNRKAELVRACEVRMLAARARQQTNNFRFWEEALYVLQKKAGTVRTLGDLQKYMESEDTPKDRPRILQTPRITLEAILNGSEECEPPDLVALADKAPGFEEPTPCELSYRTAGGALLLAVHLLSLEGRVKLTKPQIITKAQRFTNESFRQVRGEYYNAWVAMHDLVRRRLVNRFKLSKKMLGDKDEFGITERGSYWGEKVVQDYTRRGDNVSPPAVAGVGTVGTGLSSMAAPVQSASASLAGMQDAINDEKAQKMLRKNPGCVLELAPDDPLQVMGTQNVTAKVQSETRKRKQFNVSLKFQGGVLQSGDCDCEDYKKGTKICKHMRVVRIVKQNPDAIGVAASPAEGARGARGRARRGTRGRSLVALPASLDDSRSNNSRKKSSGASLQAASPTSRSLFANFTDLGDLAPDFSEAPQLSRSIPADRQMASFSGTGRRLSDSTSMPIETAGSQQSLNVRREAFLSRVASCTRGSQRASQALTATPSTAATVSKQDTLQLEVSDAEIASSSESFSTSSDSCSGDSEDDAEVQQAKRLSLESSSTSRHDMNVAASAVPPSDVALLVDNRERTSDGTRQQSYASFVSRIEHHSAKMLNQGVRFQVCFTKHLLADYAWANLSGQLNFSIAVERKTIENLVVGSGREEQLRQTRKLRAAGFFRVAVLLEGTPAQVKKDGLHKDRATITSEESLYEYMFEEQLVGVFFVETQDQERTALWLAAMSSMLCIGSSDALGASDNGPMSWTSIVAKPAQSKVQLPTPINCKDCVLSTFASTCQHEVKDIFGERADDILKCCTSLAQIRTFVKLVLARIGHSRLQAELLLIVRLGVSNATAALMLDLAGCFDDTDVTEPTAKHRRAMRPQARLVNEINGWALKDAISDRLLFTVTISHIAGSKIVDMVRLEEPRSSDVPEQMRRARELACRVAQIAGLHARRDASELDAGVLVIEGLETAQRNALKQDSRLGEAFEQRLLFLLAAFLLMGVSVKCCQTERSRLMYEQAVKCVLERRCAATSADSFRHLSKSSGQGDPIELDD